LSKIIRTVAVKIKAETSDFEKKMQSVQKSMKSTASNISNVGSALTKYATVPAAAAVVGIAALVKKTAEYGDTIDEMSQRTGLSIKTLQQLKYVSGQVGAEFTDVESGIAKFTTTLKGSLGGGGKASLFEALKIDLRDINGNIRPVNELFMESIRKIGGLSDETLQGLAANELFGKSFESLMPLMRMSNTEFQTMMNKAVSLGLVMGDEDVKAMGALNDKLEEVKNQFTAMGMRVATKFMPIIEDKLIPALEDKIIPAAIRLAEKIGDLITKFTELDPAMQDTILAAGALTVATGPLLSALGSVIGVLAKIPGIASAAGASLAGLGAVAAVAIPAVATAAIVMPGAIKEHNATLDAFKKSKATQDAKAAGQLRPMTDTEKLIGQVVPKTTNADWEKFRQDAVANKYPASYIQQYVKEQTDAAKKQQTETVKTTTDYEKALKELFDTTEEGAGDAASKLDGLRSAAEGFISTIKEQTKAFANFVGLFDVFERKSVSGERLLNRLKAQVKAMGEWRSSLSTLEKRGVGSEMISDLRSMGPGSVDSINALAKMSDAQLKEYTGLYGKKYDMAGAESSKLFSSGQKAQTIIEKQINLNVTGSKQDADAITNAIVKKLRLAGVNI
jgi:hypothetical protein